VQCCRPTPKDVNAKHIRHVEAVSRKTAYSKPYTAETLAEFIGWGGITCFSELSLLQRNDALR
jgi:hypothetical protein